jgi:predicted nucleotidyltransferase
MSNPVDIQRIRAVHEALEELAGSVVYVGGATVSLYADRKQVFEFRPTDDVDILVELISRAEFIQLEEKLRSKGFTHDIHARYVGRYIVQGITVDVMPTLPEVLGFTNHWYVDGFARAEDYTIDEFCTVKIFSPPYFIASKLEAFKTRGVNADGVPDGRFSQDFEDILFVLENRSTIWNEMNAAEPEMLDYLISEFRQLLDNPFAEEWISGYASYGSPDMTYVILDQIEQFTRKPERDEP